MKRIWFVLCLGLVSQAAVSQDRCTPSLIGSLKTEISGSSSDVISKQLKEAACHESAGASSFAGGVMDVVGFSGNKAEQSSACSKNNLKYFEQHSSEYKVSFLAPEAFDAVRQICDALDGHAYAYLLRPIPCSLRSWREI